MTRIPFALLSGGAIAAAAACFMTPAIAQPDWQNRRGPDPYQPWNSGSARDSVTVPPGEVARGYDPGTAHLNRAVAAASRRSWQPDPEAEAQYQTDLASYDEALRAHSRQVARRSADYAQRRQAYAQAMEAWRAQVAACEDGYTMACAGPAPRPDDYY